jgi:hypothetical protein
MVGLGGRELTASGADSKAAGWTGPSLCKLDCIHRRLGRLRPVAPLRWRPLRWRAGPGGQLSGKSSCWRVGERRVTVRP